MYSLLQVTCQQEMNNESPHVDDPGRRIRAQLPSKPLDGDKGAQC